MLISSLALGVAAGLAFGGRLERLARLELAWWALLPIAVAVRLIAPAVGDASAALYVAAFAGIAAVALVNHVVPGMLLIATGAVLNLAVVAVNGGMPVDPNALAAAGISIPTDRLHMVLGADSRLPFLADIIPLPPIRGVYSLGDVLLAAGGFWVPFSWLRRR